MKLVFMRGGCSSAWRGTPFVLGEHELVPEPCCLKQKFEVVGSEVRVYRHAGTVTLFHQLLRELDRPLGYSSKTIGVALVLVLARCGFVLRSPDEDSIGYLVSSHCVAVCCLLYAGVVAHTSKSVDRGRWMVHGLVPFAVVLLHRSSWPTSSKHSCCYVQMGNGVARFRRAAHRVTVTKYRGM